MKNKTAVLLLLLLLLAVSCTKEEKSISIEYSINPNQDIYYFVKSDSHIKTQSGDTIISDTTTNHQSVVHQSFRQKINDESCRLTETHFGYENLPHNFKNIKIDSSAKKFSFDYNLSRSGEISNITLEKSVKPGTFEYIKNTLEQGAPHFPIEMITPGYSWTQNTKVMIGDEFLEASTRYKFLSFIREGGYDCAQIKYEGNMIIPINADENDIEARSGIEHIKLKGVLYFAYKEGFVVLQRESWETNGSYSYLNQDNNKEPFKLYRFSNIEMALASYSSN